jgi:hydrogenase-4 component B
VVLGYSSVENVGIIVLGVGVGLWGVTREAWPVAVFCFCGSWLHMINHMLSKSLLFLATSAVTQTTGTDDLARLGGLLKRMPVTGRAFGMGAMSLAAMVPLNAFNSELLIYNGLFLGVLTLGAAGRDLAILSVAVMGMIGGLAAVCFSGVWGLGFLGNARSESSATADESALEPRMKWALNLMSFMVLFLGVMPLAGLWLVWAPVVSLLNQLGCPNGAQLTTYDSIRSILVYMSIVSAILVGLVDTLGRSFSVDILRSFGMGPANARAVGPAISSMLIYVLMAAVLFFRPTGLFPAKGR